MPVKWSWQWGKPHIKATLSDVLVTWFAVRIRPCRAQTWANTFRMETWKQEWNKSGCPGHQDCGGIKFPSLCFMPWHQIPTTCGSYQETAKPTSSVESFQCFQQNFVPNLTPISTGLWHHQGRQPCIYSAYCPQCLEATSWLWIPRAVYSKKYEHAC